VYFIDFYSELHQHPRLYNYHCNWHAQQKKRAQVHLRSQEQTPPDCQVRQSITHATHRLTLLKLCHRHRPTTAEPLSVGLDSLTAEK